MDTHTHTYPIYILLYIRWSTTTVMVVAASTPPSDGPQLHRCIRSTSFGTLTYNESQLPAVDKNPGSPGTLCSTSLRLEMIKWLLEMATSMGKMNENMIDRLTMQNLGYSTLFSDKPNCS